MAQWCSTKVGRHPISRTNQSKRLAAVENTHLICCQPVRVVGGPSDAAHARPQPLSPGSLHRSRVQIHGSGLQKTFEKHSSLFVSLRVKKHGAAFPEINEKHCFLLAVLRQEGATEESERRRLVRAMCFAIRPDSRHGISSGRHHCDQNQCQHKTHQQKTSKQAPFFLTARRETVTKHINVNMSKQNTATQKHFGDRLR